MSIAVSAWGFLIEEAMAAESKEDFTVEVIARRAPLGIQSQTIVVDGVQVTKPQEERPPLYEPNTSESSSDDRSDD